MAMISDLLFQLAGSAMAETELAAELRTDLDVVRRCLRRLSALEVVEGPTGGESLWSAVPEDAPFDVMVSKAKQGGVNVREALPAFGVAAG